MGARGPCYVSGHVIPARVYHYRDPAAVVLGLGELRNRGLTPRGILFIALDPRGETYVAVPDDFTMVTDIRVGDKMTLKPPWDGRYYHFKTYPVCNWSGDLGPKVKQGDSLSGIAQAITGTKWNGPRFFGLRGADRAV